MDMNHNYCIKFSLSIYQCIIVVAILHNDPEAQYEQIQFNSYKIYLLLPIVHHSRCLYSNFINYICDCLSKNSPISH